MPVDDRVLQLCLVLASMTLGHQSSLDRLIHVVERINSEQLNGSVLDLGPIVESRCFE
jgi:hypothetical protein